MARKCRICFEAYQPEALAVDDGLGLGPESRAGVIHRRHTPSGSISSISSDKTSSDDGDGFLDKHSSHFYEHCSGAQTLQVNCDACEISLSDDEKTSDHSMLHISGAAAQQRRRRGAYSRGLNSNNDPISIGLSIRKLRPRTQAVNSQEEFYHLNGVRMIF